MSKEKRQDHQEPEVEIITAKPIVRTIAGLRDRLFDKMDDFEMGNIQTARFLAFMRGADQLHKNFALELAVQKFALDNPKAPALFPPAEEDEPSATRQ